MEIETENEIRRHLKACMDHIGYETKTESMLSMTILLREHVTGQRMDKELVKTGLEHWGTNGFGIELKNSD